MGIEARRDLKENLEDKEGINDDIIDEDKSKLLNNDLSISGEIFRLNKLREDSVLSEEEYVKAQEQYGEDSFVASIGAEAIRDLLVNLDLKSEKETNYLLRLNY